MQHNWRGEIARYKTLFLNLTLMYRQKPTVRMFLELFLTVSTSTVFLIFALRPTLITISTLITENKSKEETAKVLDQKITDLGTARTNYNAALSQIEILKQSVPDTPQANILMGQLEALAKNDNSTITNVNIGEAYLWQKTEGSEVDDKPITFTLNASGSYPDVFKLASDVENLRRPVFFETVTISVGLSEKEEGIRNINISGKAPFTESYGQPK